LSKLGTFEYRATDAIKSGQMRKASFKSE